MSSFSFFLLDIDSHNANIHPESGLTCDVCKKEFTNKIAFEKHRNRVHQNLVCDLCGRVLSSQQSYQYHLVSKSGDLVWHLLVIHFCN